MNHVRSGIALVLFTLYIVGCASRERQLERVAKDWCATIRASQVIPVYPLTEDLRPGDVFLVRRSSAEQQKEFEGKGFLALDDFRARLARMLHQRNGTQL